MSKTLSNLLMFILVGMALSLFFLIGSGSPITVQGVMFANAQVFVLGTLLNPFAGLSFILVAVSVFMRDTPRGNKILAKRSVWFQKLFGQLRWPLLSMAIAAAIGAAIMVLNPNWWALISIYPMAQILVFLGLRQLRDNYRR